MEMNGHGQDSALGQAGTPAKATTRATARRRGSGPAAGDWRRNGLAGGFLDPGDGVLRTRHLCHPAGQRADGFRPNRTPAKARRQPGDRQAHLRTPDRAPGLAGGAGAQATGCPCFLRPPTSYSSVRRGRRLVDPVPPRAVTTGLAVPKRRPPPGARSGPTVSMGLARPGLHAVKHTAFALACFAITEPVPQSRRAVRAPTL